MKAFASIRSILLAHALFLALLFVLLVLVLTFFAVPVNGADQMPVENFN